MSLQVAFLDGKLVSSIAICALGYLLYTIGLGVYYLYLSKLAGFPGPKIAAMTSWYEFYYDYWCSGRYIFEVEKMHQKYGPIVRVTPYELSIHDANFYNEIYVTESKRRTNHYDIFCQGMGFDDSHLLTTDHDLHRLRRKPLEPFFSRQGVSRLQPMLAEVAEKLASRIEALKGTKSVIRLDHAFSAFSSDVIGKICWDGKEELLDDPEFAPEWFNVIHAIVRSIPLFSGFPLIVRILSYIPQSVLLRAYPMGELFKKFKIVAKRHVAIAKREKLENDLKGLHMERDSSLFSQIVNSNMPESELADERLAMEAQVLLGAGTASTARTLGFISYYILAEPEIHSKLKQELKGPMSTYPERIPSWAELEQLPYLQALIKEALRLSYGVMHRLPRCSPDVPIQYKQWTIPVGVPVGMSGYLMHSDPNVYPRPFEYVPERWLGNIDPTMVRNYVPFCRGSRNCLGINLAQAEMSLALAVLYQPNGPQFELFETDESDVRLAHDFLVPLPKLDTKGVRILIR